MAINYFTEDISFLIKGKRIISAWLRTNTAQHGSSIDTVNIIFCSEAYLLAMNQKYLEHDYHTDILTFPYGDQKNISGDLFISVDMAHYNAAGYNISFEYEILRVVAHGLLHLLGYNDKSEKDQKEMRFIEEKWLKSLSDFHKQGKLPVGFTWNKKSISS